MKTKVARSAVAAAHIVSSCFQHYALLLLLLAQVEKLIKTAGNVANSKTGDAHAVDHKVVLAKLNSHLLWKFFALTVLCYIDRTNLAFAAIQLNKNLGFTEHIYGVGASIFFVGYSICQIPSNLVLVRVGAPLWLSVLIVSWGIVATAFAAINGKWMFYILRLLLGATESGTFPGMWYVDQSSCHCHVALCCKLPHK